MAHNIDDIVILDLPVIISNWDQSQEELDYFLNISNDIGIVVEIGNNRKYPIEVHIDDIHCHYHFNSKELIATGLTVN